MGVSREHAQEMENKEFGHNVRLGSIYHAAPCYLLVGVMVLPESVFVLLKLS